jgi:hypothetical protein
MEALVSYETLVRCYNTVRHTEEDSSFHTYHCENLKSPDLLRGITYSSGPMIGWFGARAESDRVKPAYNGTVRDLNFRPVLGLFLLLQALGKYSSLVM